MNFEKPKNPNYAAMREARERDLQRLKGQIEYWRQQFAQRIGVPIDNTGDNLAWPVIALAATPAPVAPKGGSDAVGEDALRRWLNEGRVWVE